MTSFSQFSLDPAVLAALEKKGYTEPTLVQKEAIPHILAGRDLIALAATGSGKTAACSIPICHKVDPKRVEVQALVIVPTRELALQYATEVQKVGNVKGVKAFAIMGGEDAGIQLAKLKSGVQVLVATPGRLIDFIFSRSISLEHVETLILDEADKMLSMGFYEDLEFIIQCLNHEHQTLLFSATMSKEINVIAKHHMKDPVELKLQSEEASPAHIDHRFLYCSHGERDEMIIQQIEELKPKQAIIFCHSRIQVEKVTRGLQRHFPSTDYLHAGMTQQIRTSVTNKYRSGKIKYLVATDVASRGLDFSNVTHVFIYELADDPLLYIHRAGRTGRNEKEGMVITLVTNKELHRLKNVLKVLKQEANWIGTPPPADSRPSRRPRSFKGHK